MLLWNFFFFFCILAALNWALPVAVLSSPVLAFLLTTWLLYHFHTRHFLRGLKKQSPLILETISRVSGCELSPLESKHPLQLFPPNGSMEADIRGSIHAPQPLTPSNFWTASLTTILSFKTQDSCVVHTPSHCWSQNWHSVLVSLSLLASHQQRTPCCYTTDKGYFLFYDRRKRWTLVSRKCLNTSSS